MDLVDEKGLEFCLDLASESLLPPFARIIVSETCHRHQGTLCLFDKIDCLRRRVQVLVRQKGFGSPENYTQNTDVPEQILVCHFHVKQYALVNGSEEEQNSNQAPADETSHARHRCHDLVLSEQFQIRFGMLIGRCQAAIEHMRQLIVLPKGPLCDTAPLPPAHITLLSCRLRSNFVGVVHDEVEDHEQEHEREKHKLGDSDSKETAAKLSGVITEGWTDEKFFVVHLAYDAQMYRPFKGFAKILLLGSFLEEFGPHTSRRSRLNVWVDVGVPGPTTTTTPSHTTSFAKTTKRIQK